jgi:hypothetical protein
MEGFFGSIGPWNRASQAARAGDIITVIFAVNHATNHAHWLVVTLVPS